MSIQSGCSESCSPREGPAFKRRRMTHASFQGRREPRRGPGLSSQGGSRGKHSIYPAKFQHLFCHLHKNVFIIFNNFANSCILHLLFHCPGPSHTPGPTGISNSIHIFIILHLFHYPGTLLHNRTPGKYIPSDPPSHWPCVVHGWSVIQSIRYSADSERSCEAS